MSDHIEGIVAKITSKEAGQNGNLVYNICMEIGEDDEWFGHGFDEPTFYEGDEIEFDVVWNGDFANIDTGSVNIIAEGDGEPKPKAKPKGRGNSRGSSRGSSSRGSSRGSSSKPSRSSSRGSSRDKPAAKPSRGAAKTDAMSKEEWAQKDQIIRRQACMNTAINLIKLVLEQEAVKLPTKKSDQFDAIVALCDEEAVRLYDQYEEQVHGSKTAKRGGRSNRPDYDDDIPE